MARKLTAAAVERLRPGKTRREVPDGGCPGLYLIIQNTGHKSWALRFRRPGGQPAKLTLGVVDSSGKEAAGEPVVGMPLTLASARGLATAIHRERAMGKDVVAVRHRERLERDAHGAKTFAAAAAHYIDQYAMPKTRGWRDRARLLGLRPAADGKGLELIPKGLADRWGDRPIAEIDCDDVHLLVEEARSRGVPGAERRAKGPSQAQARAMFAGLSKLFSWLVEQRRLRSNPCTGVHRPAMLKARDRVLNNSEIVAFWRAADAERVEFGALLKVLLLTGCRLREVAGMSRTEISDDGATWIIPGERTKNARAHVVPLSPLVRSLIASVGTDGNLIFTTNGSTPPSGWSKIKNRLGAAMKIPPWRLHDLRRTTVTGMAELGIRPDVIELAVNHISGSRGGIAGVYNRSELLDERRAALERWSQHVAGLVSGKPENVVTLARKRGRK
jgi:integrase